MGRTSCFREKMGVFCFRDFLLSAFFAVIICADKVSYRDVHVFRIDAKNQKDLDKVKSIRNAYPTDHIWRSANSASPEGQLVHLAYSKRQVREVRDAPDQPPSTSSTVSSTRRNTGISSMA